MGWKNQTGWNQIRLELLQEFPKRSATIPSSFTRSYTTWSTQLKQWQMAWRKCLKRLSWRSRKSSTDSLTRRSRCILVAHTIDLLSNFWRTSREIEGNRAGMTVALFAVGVDWASIRRKVQSPSSWSIIIVSAKVPLSIETVPWPLARASLEK